MGWSWRGGCPKESNFEGGTGVDQFFSWISNPQRTKGRVPTEEGGGRVELATVEIEGLLDG